MAHQWDALIDEDHEMMMPLPFRKKFGIRYLFQPAFIQQLGIFSGKEITPELSTLFLEKAFQYFRFAEFTLNYSNPVADRFKPKQRSNYIIPLDEDLRFGIITNDKKFYRELEVAELAGLVYETGNDPSSSIHIYQKLYGSRFPFIRKNDFKNFEKLCLSLDENDVIIRSAKKGDSLHAQCLLIKYKDRLYNLANSTTDEGRASSANFFLLNEVVKEFSGRGLTLDLEGSDVEGIAYFYRRLGSSLQPYPFIRYNGLPWPLKLIKQV